MTWETDFDALMVDTVQRAPYTGQNEFGEATYGPAAPVQCRVVRKPRVLHRSGVGAAVSGAVQEVVSTATVYCSGVPEWTGQDQITLPDGSTPLILQVDTYPDEDGLHHQVVYV